MQRQTPKRNRWTSLSVMTMIVMLGSSVGCVSIKHYVRHHSVVASVGEKHQSAYFHCSHCGQIMPKEGFSKCPRCFQVPAYHGYEPTCWRQWPEGWGCTPESVINNPEFWAEGMLESDHPVEETATEVEEDPASQSDRVDPPQVDEDIPLPTPEQVNAFPATDGTARFQQNIDFNEVPANDIPANGGFTQLTPAQSTPPTFFEPSVSEVTIADEVDEAAPVVESFTPQPAPAVPKTNFAIEYDDPPAPVQAAPAKPAPVKAAPVKPATVQAAPVKPIQETVSEVVQETVSEPVAVVEAAKKKVAAPVQETVTAPVQKKVSEPVTKIVTPPAAKTITEPASKSVIAPVKETISETAKDVSETTKKKVAPVIRDVRTDLFGNPVEFEATPSFERPAATEEIQSQPAKEPSQIEPSPLFEFRRQAAVNGAPSKRGVTETEQKIVETPSSTFKPVNRIPLPKSVQTLDQRTVEATSDAGNESKPVEYKINDLQVSTKAISAQPASIMMQPTATDRRPIVDRQPSANLQSSGNLQPSHVPTRPSSVLSTANVSPQLSSVSVLRQSAERNATTSPSTMGRSTTDQAARAQYAPIPVRRIQPPRNVQTSASISGQYHPAPVSRIPLNALPLKVAE